MVNRNSYKIHILCGLPGSGKTTFVKGKRHVIDFDTINKNLREAKPELSGAERLLIALKGTVYYKTTISSEHYYDGLFTNQSQYEILVEYIEKNFKNRDIIFHFWKENREACLWNDRGRRELSSAATIKNCLLEKPDIKALSKIHQRTFLVEHEVIMKSKKDLWLDEVVWEGSEYWSGRTNMDSDSWSLGGTWGSCWDDTLHSCSPDEPLASFKEFDDLMIRICPNIGFMQYKVIYNNSVSMRTSSDHDYYGGSTSDCRYTCDLNYLYDEMVKLGLIPEEYI